jgi:circadian clock protein KaiB
MKKPPARVSWPFEFVLYISGATANSTLALLNLSMLAEKHLKGKYHLSVVDMYQHPRWAGKHNVIALPMLVKTLPLPVRRMVGDLSNESRVLTGLGLVPAPATAMGDRQ